MKNEDLLTIRNSINEPIHETFQPMDIITISPHIHENIISGKTCPPILVSSGLQPIEHNPPTYYTKHGFS